MPQGTKNTWNRIPSDQLKLPQVISSYLNLGYLNLGY